MKKHNFSARPSILPRSVIEQASNGIVNINNLSLALIEISHRSKDFVDIMDRATSLALELLDLNNKGYKALFLQGGASMQFLMTAYNLLENKAGYINTGAWSTKALKEAKNFGDAIEVATSKDANFNYIPKNYSLDSDLDYLHITTNNTIFGTQFHELPKTNTNLICDMSSDIFSRNIDFSKFSLIYAGAQKNMGPAGTTLVVVKEEILGKVSRTIPFKFGIAKTVDKTASVIPGNNFNTNTLSSKSRLTLSFFDASKRSNKSLLTLRCTPDSANSGKFGEANALKCSALILVVLFPRYNLYSKYKPTSLMIGFPFSCREAI